MSKLSVAVIGAGHLGRVHARLLSGMADVELVGVADPDAAARQQVATDCGTQAFADHQELIGRIDAAVLAAPTRLHHAVGLDLIGHGVHLLVEKPLAATHAEARQLHEAAVRQGVVLQVGHIERFSPALAAATPHLVDPRFIEASRTSEFTFRSTDIGVVLDLMIHDLDVALSLVRSPVKSVRAWGVAVVDGHEDVAQAWLEFANGAIAALGASRVSAQARRQMQVWTPRTWVSLDFGERTASVMRPSETLFNRQLNVDAVAPADRAAWRQRLHAEHLPVESLTVDRAGNPLAEELRDFVQSIRAQRAPRVGGWQGCEALAVAEWILSEIHSRSGSAPAGDAEILRGPHWDHAAHAQPPRREAG